MLTDDRKGLGPPNKTKAFHPHQHTLINESSHLRLKVAQLVLTEREGPGSPRHRGLVLQLGQCPHAVGHLGGGVGSL